MSRNPTHKWLLRTKPDAQKAFDHLPSAQKQAVFRRLQELLSSDDPYSLGFVEMLKAKEFERIRKFRAGDYRVFFSIRSGEVIDQQHTYKGKLYLLEIRDRKDAY